MWPDRRRFLLAIVFTLAPLPVTAHHSSAAFDDKTETVLDGVVTKYEWANPHVYLYLRVRASADVWEIEGGPVALMRRLGWSRETLASGEHALVTVNPAKAAARKGLLVAVRKDDGTTFNKQEFVAAASTPPPAPHGLVGVWGTEL